MGDNNGTCGWLRVDPRTFRINTRCYKRYTVVSDVPNGWELCNVKFRLSRCSIPGEGYWKSILDSLDNLITVTMGKFYLPHQLMVIAVISLYSWFIFLGYDWWDAAYSLEVRWVSVHQRGSSFFKIPNWFTTHQPGWNFGGAAACLLPFTLAGVL